MSSQLEATKKLNWPKAAANQYKAKFSDFSQTNALIPKPAAKKKEVNMQSLDQKVLSVQTRLNKTSIGARKLSDGALAGKPPLLNRMVSPKPTVVDPFSAKASISTTGKKTLRDSFEPILRST